MLLELGLIAITVMLLGAFGLVAALFLGVMVLQIDKA